MADPSATFAVLNSSPRSGHLDPNRDPSASRCVGTYGGEGSASAQLPVGTGARPQTMNGTGMLCARTAGKQKYFPMLGNGCSMP